MGTSYSQTPPLHAYAYVKDLYPKLEYLSSLAESENWYYNRPSAKNEQERKLGVLFQYIHHTFAKALADGLIYEDESHSIMNTGLLTENGEEIYLVFSANRNPGRQKWYLESFQNESSRKIPKELRGNLPDYVNYFKDRPEDMYFDTSLNITAHMDHIVRDNFTRLPKALQSYEFGDIVSIFEHAKVSLRKRIARNSRLIVLQCYNDKIMYLAPLKAGGSIVPLALERLGNEYRINTIFTPGMAYCNARLINKPESNWLVNTDGVADNCEENDPFE